jgi:hypothetical protein
MNPYFPALLPQLLMAATARRALLSTEARQPNLTATRYDQDNAGMVSGAAEFAVSGPVLARRRTIRLASSASEPASSDA